MIHNVNTFSHHIVLHLNRSLFLRRNRHHHLPYRMASINIHHNYDEKSLCKTKYSTKTAKTVPLLLRRIIVIDDSDHRISLSNWIIFVFNFKSDSLQFYQHFHIVNVQGTCMNKCVNAQKLQSPRLDCSTVAYIIYRVIFLQFLRVKSLDLP